MMRPWRILLDPTPAAGGGSITEPIIPAVVVPAVDPNVGFVAALKKHGDDAASLARTAYTDSERLRVENTELRGKLPKEGSVVLAPAEAASYHALVKLGKPDEIATALESGKTAVGLVAAFERKELLGEASKPYGFSTTVLTRLANQDGLTIEIKDGSYLGKAGKIAEVVTTEKDAKGADVEKRETLDKYAAKHWAEFLPSLKASTVTAPRTGAGTGRLTPVAPNRRDGESAPNSTTRRRPSF